MSSLKIRLGLFVIMLGLAGLFFVKFANKPSANPTSTSERTSSSAFDKPQIVATKPDPLEHTIVSTTQVIEITFNRPLENVGEFKLRIEPKTDFKVELSGDRKTARIIPLQPYGLGQEYSLFI